MNAPILVWLTHNQGNNEAVWRPNILFVFCNFPLNDIHLLAQHMAEVIEDAEARNKYWQMHDYLFGHQKALDDRHLLEY